MTPAATLSARPHRAYPPIHCQPLPTAPMLLRPAPHRPMQFESLDQLARHIHAQRAGRPIELQPERRSLPGSPTFPGFSIWICEPEGDSRRWLGFAFIQNRPREALQDAIIRTEEKAQ